MIADAEHLNPEDYRDLIHNQGQAIEWYRGMVCPCTDRRSREQNPDCALCAGVGWYYQEMDVSAFKALVTGVSPFVEYAAFGEIMSGDCIVSTMPDEIPIDAPDKVVAPTDRKVRHSEVVVRSQSGDTDALWGQNVTEVIYLRDLTTVYAEIEDFLLDGDQIDWSPSGSTPTAGTQYTVLYQFQPTTYKCLGSLPTRRRAVAGTLLPQRAFCRIWVPETHRS